MGHVTGAQMAAGKAHMCRVRPHEVSSGSTSTGDGLMNQQDISSKSYLLWTLCKRVGMAWHGLQKLHAGTCSHAG